VLLESEVVRFIFAGGPQTYGRRFSLNLPLWRRDLSRGRWRNRPWDFLPWRNTRKKSSSTASLW